MNLLPPFVLDKPMYRLTASLVEAENPVPAILDTHSVVESYLACSQDAQVHTEIFEPSWPMANTAGGTCSSDRPQ